MDQIRDVRAKPDRKAGRKVKGQTWDRAARKVNGPTWVTRDSLANKVSPALRATPASGGNSCAPPKS